METQFQNYEALQARLDDLAELSLRRHQSVCSNFLSENECAYVQETFGKHVPYRLDGGHPNAKRCQVVFEWEGEGKAESVSLTATYREQFGILTHRDVLGALMGLNLERNQIGDIGILGEQIHLIVTQKVAEYVQTNLVQIGRAGVHFQTEEPTWQVEEKVELFTDTISSLRIDCVVASCCGFSRQKAQQALLAQRVQRNHETLVEYDALCHNGDTISIRGWGRFRVEKVLKETKKGRLLVQFARYV